jgi:O-acetyl-ADP-ribose deacetylase (regulator of RNase III)
MLHHSTAAATAINYVIGDATSPKASGPKIIVHICNNVGAWGKGFVVALSRRWAEPEKRYRAWYRGEENQVFALGQVQFVIVAVDTWVANLIGQRDIRASEGRPPIRYDAVREGLRRVADEARHLGASIHMPRIGCGLAGGKWEEIGLIVQQELSAKGITVTVYDLPQ